MVDIDTACYYGGIIAHTLAAGDDDRRPSRSASPPSYYAEGGGTDTFQRCRTPSPPPHLRKRPTPLTDGPNDHTPHPGVVWLDHQSMEDECRLISTGHYEARALDFVDGVRWWQEIGVTWRWITQHTPDFPTRWNLMQEMDAISLELNRRFADGQSPGQMSLLEKRMKEIGRECYLEGGQTWQEFQRFVYRNDRQMQFFCMETRWGKPEQLKGILRKAWQPVYPVK